MEFVFCVIAYVHKCKGMGIVREELNEKEPKIVMHLTQKYRKGDRHAGRFVKNIVLFIYIEIIFAFQIIVAMDHSNDYLDLSIAVELLLIERFCIFLSIKSKRCFVASLHFEMLNFAYIIT